MKNKKFIEFEINKPEVKDEEILIINTFTGKYLQENIGHEIINIFKDDNNNSYIYVPPYGKIHNRHKGRVTKVLITRYLNNNVFEILAKATDIEDVYFKCIDSQITPEEYINNNEISYRNRLLGTIWNLKDDAIFTSKAAVNIKGENHLIYITYKANNVVKPKKKLYLIINSGNSINYNESVTDEIRLPEIDRLANNQSMKRYLSKDDKDFKIINEKIFENEVLWGDELPCILKDKIDTNNKFNFLSLIKREYDELAFSNMISFFLENDKKTLFKFIDKVLKLDIKPDESFDYNITREENNVDLIIRTKTKFIIIENKIKSHLNGIKKNEDGEIIRNQLDKYYEYAKIQVQDIKVNDKEKILYEDDKGKTIHCYLLEPNYNNIIDDKDIFKTITYKEVYEFFKDNTYNGFGKEYYNDFVNSLYKHTKESDSNLYDEMQIKFAKTLDKK